MPLPRGPSFRFGQASTAIDAREGSSQKDVVEVIDAAMDASFGDITIRDTAKPIIFMTCQRVSLWSTPSALEPARGGMSTSRFPGKAALFDDHRGCPQGPIRKN